MSNFLDEIIELKKGRLETAKTETKADELKKNAFRVREKSEPHLFRKALMRKGKFNIIAEFKRASPSKGMINEKVDVVKCAKDYEEAGACAVSVLTEEDKFLGSLDDLRMVRQTISLPVLRKDFIFDEFQIFEAVEAGADAVLLIAAVLEDERLQTLHHLAESVLGVDALVEVHTLEELKRVDKMGFKIIGINNRDLHSFRVNLDVSRDLIKHGGPETLFVSESGIKTPEDLIDLNELGFDGFLIGETLMKSENISGTLNGLIN